MANSELAKSDTYLARSQAFSKKFEKNIEEVKTHLLSKAINAAKKITDLMDAESGDPALLALQLKAATTVLKFNIEGQPQQTNIQINNVNIEHEFSDRERREMLEEYVQ